MESGCLSRVNKIDSSKINGIKSKVMSENSLIKILVLGIKDKESTLFLWSFKKKISFLVYKTKVFS